MGILIWAIQIIIGPKTRNGYMSKWSSWSECSEICGKTGTKLRTRKCIKPKYGGFPCPKYKTKQTKKCFPGDCHGKFLISHILNKSMLLLWQFEKIIILNIFIWCNANSWWRMGRVEWMGILFIKLWRRSSKSISYLRFACAKSWCWQYLAWLWKGRFKCNWD